MTTPAAPTSRYAAIAAQLREKILNETYATGQKLPTEREMEETFKTSRVTVRRALRALIEERLIVRRQGSGTYVSARPERRIPLMIDYTGSMRDHAPSLERRVLAWRWEECDAATAEVLEIEPGDEILCAERVDTLGGQPVACDRAFIVASFGRHLKEARLARVDFIECWTETEGFEVEACQQTIEALTASPAVYERLGLAEGHPVLKSTEVYLTRHERPAGLFTSFYHPEQICITSRYRWSPGHKTKTGRETSP